MIVDFSDVTEAVGHDVCIVGAGPIGIALALSCAANGLKVLLLESGTEKPSAFHADLNAGNIRDVSAHTALQEASCRALGGTSHWWGGRCVPFDPIDFQERPGVMDAQWPIAYEDAAAWYERAAAFFQCGSSFSMEGPWTGLTGLRFDQVERWCPRPNMAWVHRAALQDSPGITVVLGATVTDLQFSPDRSEVVALTVVDGERSLVIPTPLAVLACGGVQTPRLLLSVQRREPALFGGTGGPLGRFYMGHLFGKIANIVLNDANQAEALDFFMDQESYVRRRFTFPTATLQQEQLLNTSFAAGNARIFDPEHRSGALSMIWLMLASPLGKRLLPDALLKIYVGEGQRRYGAHLANVARTAFPTLISAVQIYRDRYLRKPAKPAVFLWNAGGRYTLHYHSEQAPDAECRLTLTDDDVDAYATPRLDVSHRYAREDADRIVRAHEVLDRALRGNRIGRLEFDLDRVGSVDSVLAQARDGMHQMGAARMSDDPARGVVDRDCRVHDAKNLFIASTCVFPSSGNANPTFLGVALALRLGEHLAAGAREKRKREQSGAPWRGRSDMQNARGMLSPATNIRATRHS